MADYNSSEQAGLVGPGGRESKPEPDWGRYGLSKEQQEETARKEQAELEEGYHQHDQGNQNELFAQDQSSKSKPWWKANFFVSEPVLFGTWDGVFTSCMINIFGVIIFLRTGWMVGNAGIGFSVLIIFMTIIVALITVTSTIGVCERCRMQSGGVYFLLSHVLGARIGASIGIAYCFGQAVACSLYVVGFGESISALIYQNQEPNPWVSRGIATGVLMLLLGINVAGVKWVIRLQLILLMVLCVAVLDFLVGSFVHTDPANGVMGYSVANLVNNTYAGYQEGESFFTVFGVFFPTATGVMAGINMSGDLRHPSRNIPVGTLSAIGVSTALYLSFALVLGSTCVRYKLQTDYMIAEKVSIVGVLWLAGLYISSISSCMGGLYGSPRVLQCIANENVIPIIKVLGRGRGPNKVPVYSLIVVTLISLIFIFVGKVNTLGPIVTMPFLLTYAAVDYAYFALAMSFDKQQLREARFKDTKNYLSPNAEKSPLEDPSSKGTTPTYGTLGEKKSANDLDNLFPERVQDHRGLYRQGSVGSPTSPTFDLTKGKEGEGEGKEEDTAELLDSDKVCKRQRTNSENRTIELPDSTETQSASKPVNVEITRQPRSFYSFMCNRWVSVLGLIACFVIMFAIQWAYALVIIVVVLLVYIYIGQANPGVFPGIAEFCLWEWIRDGVRNCCRRGPPPAEQIVVTPNTPAMNTMAAQLTEDNEDFASRGRYHQSEVVKGENFDDYSSD